MSGRGYDGRERRSSDEIEERIESIERRLSIVEEKNSDSSRAALARNCADAVFDAIYKDIGRNFVRAMLWVLGTFTVVGLVWLAATGRLKVASLTYQFVTTLT